MGPLLPLPASSKAHCHLSLSHFSELSFPLQFVSHAVPCCLLAARQRVCPHPHLHPQRKEAPWGRTQGTPAMVKSRHPDPNNPTPPSFPEEPQKASEVSPASDSQPQSVSAGLV